MADTTYKDLIQSALIGLPADPAKRPSALGLINDFGAALDAEMTEFRDLLDGLTEAQGSDAVGAATLSALTTLATTIGLNNSTDKGTIGRVYNDTGTPANNGDYTWSGTAWVAQGLGRLGTAESNIVQGARKQTSPLAFARQPVVDLANLLGGGAAVYWPRTGSFRNATDGEVFAVSLTADSKLANHTKVAITNSSVMKVIYYDSQSAIIRVAVAGVANAPIDNTRYFHLMTIYGSATTYPGASGIVSDYDYVVTSETNCTIAGMQDSAIYDPSTSELRLPTIYGYDDGGASWSLSSDVSGEYYRVIATPTSGIWQVYVDVSKAKASPSDALAVVVLEGYGGIAPISRNGEGQLLLIGTGYYSHFTPAPGIRLARLVPNEFRCGQLDNDLAPYFRYTDASAVNLVEAASLALGFTRGFKATGVNITYGGDFDRRLTSGVMTARFFLEADTAGAFGDPGVFFRYRNADGTENVASRTLADALQLEKQHSTKVREYVTYFTNTLDREYIGCFAGSLNAPAGAVRVFGLQFAISASPEIAISHADYPRAFATLDPLIPDEFFFVTGRTRYPVYLDQMTRAAPLGRLVASVSPVASAIAVTGPLAVDQKPGGGTFTPAGTAQRIWLRDTRGPLTDIASKEVAYRSAAAAAGTKKVLCIGDSMFDTTRGLAVNAFKRLENMGFTIASLGTRTMTSEFDAGTYNTEGRAGREMGDFTNAVNTNLSPVTDWSAYLALSNAAKAAYNPFIVGGSGGNSRNGYKFRLAPYLTGTSQANPDIIVVNLHTNDETGHTPASDGVTNVYDGVRIMAAEIHADLAGVPILFVGTAHGWEKDNGRQEGVHWDALRAAMKAVRDLRTAGDTHAYLIPAYCALSRDIGYRYDSVTGADGVLALRNNDALHPGQFGVNQYGEILAQSMAAILNGA